MGDARTWIERWDRQQAAYVPHRAETFELMLDLIAQQVPEPRRILDLGCGPGALASRAHARWPAAEVIGVDLDPILLELAREGVGDGVRWVEADLRTESWAEGLADEPFGAVLSATALHWLRSDSLIALVKELGGRLRPGGVFANYDTMELGGDAPRLRDFTRRQRQALVEEASGGSAEPWEDWWAAIRREPEFIHLLAERERRFGKRHGGSAPTLNEFADALRVAGFAEVATLKQVASRHLLAAIR